jgi:hypothetical protein
MDVDESDRRVAEALAQDNDYLQPGHEVSWLIAQLACWPTRVDAEKTTNITFLRARR